MYVLLQSLPTLTSSRSICLAQFLRPLTALDFEVLMPALILVGFVVSAFVIWTLRTLHTQKMHASRLHNDLQTIREQSHRRLQFLNVLSHDLRTPLNGITLQAHVIDQALSANDLEAVARALANIHTSSNLAAEILEALLQYARIELDQNVISQVSLAQVFQQTAEPFRAAAEEKNLIFTLAIPPDLTACTDRAKLQRAVANLLDNAVKFTTQGSIRVEASLEPASDSHRPPGFTRRHEPCILIHVTDTGTGIAPNEHGRIFHEFFQSQNPSRDARFGLGLGLVMAQRLARQLGGSIEFTSEFQKGSTFTLAIPQVAPDPNAACPPESGVHVATRTRRSMQRSLFAQFFSQISFR